MLKIWKNTRTAGKHYETVALNYLKGNAFRKVTANYTSPWGEIDLIMFDPSRECLCFIEVRYRQSNTHGGAAASVTPAKQQKVIRTAQHFLQEHKAWRQYICRFDVIAISDNPPYNIQFIPSAFN